LVTQRRRRRSAEESLLEKTEELDQFFNVSLDLLCIANTDGYFLRLNPAWGRVLGHSHEELMAKRFLDFVHPDDLDRTREATSNLASQQKVSSFENRYRCKDGTYRWLQWNSAPAGNLIYAAARDITEHKRAEAEAFHARRELLRLERLSRMGELTASLAHELNQPLTSILANARAAFRFIQSDRVDVGELKEILEDIANDDKRAGDIIRSLRSMVKQEEGEREPTFINDVLQEVVSLFHSEAIIRNLTVEMDLGDSLPPVHMSKVQIQQVLVNLLMNAAESMEGEASGNRRIVVQSRAVDHDAVKVGVRDFGPGVEEKEFDKIFEPFFSTKRSGLGMGLSLSRSIIEAHGGHIWVENNPDQGATFYFDLPTIKSSDQVISDQ
jgi:two-component system sensor kinase FixL